MSIFTYHLIEALTGHARPVEGAVEVLVSDLMSHIWRRVPQSTRQDWNKDQHPDYQLTGNFPVALLLGGEGLPKGVEPPDVFESAGLTLKQAGAGSPTTGGSQFAGPVEIGGDYIQGNQSSMHCLGSIYMANCILRVECFCKFSLKFVIKNTIL
jgi:hypothetical protein